VEVKTMALEIGKNAYQLGIGAIAVAAVIAGVMTGTDWITAIGGVTTLVALFMKKIE